LHGPDATSDDIPQHEDATIGGGQVFQAMAGDPPVDAGLRVVVPWYALPLLVRPICRLAKARPTRLFLPLCKAHEAHEHGIVVVHRHCKMRMPSAIYMHLTRTGAPGGKLADIGGNVFVDAHPDVLVYPPRGDADHAGRALHPVQHGVHAQLFGKMAAGDGMEKLEVGRVHDVFLNLQPVAGVEMLY
jgi:hypothetical protein